MPINVKLRDVNGDGRLDIVTANNGTQTVGVLQGKAGGGFGPVTTYTTGAGSGPRGVALGDVNGDGRPNIITANFDTDTVGVLLVTVTAVPTLTSLSPSGPVGTSVTLTGATGVSLNGKATTTFTVVNATSVTATVASLSTVGFTPEISQANTYNTSPTPGTTTPFPTVFTYDQGRAGTQSNNLSPFEQGFVVPTSQSAPLNPMTLTKRVVLQ